jgi:endonuclease/exonuclease/phosphatase family metal-dependent hydrolase
MNDQSKRPQQIQDFLTRAKQDIASGKVVILGGDFNEASHLDWTEAVKNLYDHRGTVINWSSTATLSKAGLKTATE